MKHSFVPVHRLNEFTKQVPHRQLATKAALISPDIKANLSMLATISLTLPVSTASVERSFFSNEVD